MPRGYGPWVLCLALGVGFGAAAFAKVRGGPDWILNGTVRYHFMAEALTAARVPWGPWIAWWTLLLGEPRISWTVGNSGQGRACADVQVQVTQPRPRYR